MNALTSFPDEGTLTRSGTSLTTGDEGHLVDGIMVPWRPQSSQNLPKPVTTYPQRDSLFGLPLWPCTHLHEIIHAGAVTTQTKTFDGWLTWISVLEQYLAMRHLRDAVSALRGCRGSLAYVHRELATSTHPLSLCCRH